MSASQFINMLESKGLLDPEIISELNRQVEQSKVRVTPEAIARLLVENGQLTRFQATKLVTELNEVLGASAFDPSAALRGGKPIEGTLPKNNNDSVDDLLPPDDPDSDVVEVAEVVDQADEDVVEATEVETASKGSRSSKRKKDRSSSNLTEPLSDVAVARVSKSNKPKKNRWESFGIVGVGFIVLLLLVFFVPLYIWFSRGNAKEAFESAEELYKNRDYDRAIRQYETFATTFSTDDNASIARVKATLARVRQDAEKNADPTVALKTAQEELPKIANEAGLESMRVDITDTLMRIAEKFITKADNTASIEDRKNLITLMDEQMALIRDPRFVGTQERTQNELRIRRIEESQQRVTREIQQGQDLAATLESMKSAISASDVNKTFDLRRELVRKYPQLEPDKKLRELMLEATTIQKGLVTRAPSGPTVSVDPAPPGPASTALLTSRVGNPIEGSSEDVVFLRIKGAVVAIRVATGDVLWRTYIGRDWTSNPQRIANTSDSDPIISVASRGAISRLSAKDGSLAWESKLPERILEPSIDGDDIFVATVGGSLHCLDAISGQARWSKKIPQPVDVGFGGASGKRKRYVLGNHSNLYVFSRGNGECEEVVYVGHNPGTIVVPPIWVLNQLILFENAGPDHSLMRVFTTNDEGLELNQIQSPIRFKGHVVVEPQVEGRRLAVATNLGEIAILDVEVTNPKEKVFKMVNLVSNEAAPKVTWPLMAGTDLWLASNRLAYFQIQITGQKLNSMWLKEDLDEFTARPIKMGEAIIHTRVVRGNNGVRVAAIDPKSGNAFWETDIGTPVSTILPQPQQTVAVTSQGATYNVADDAFAKSGSPLRPSLAIENMGRNQRSMLFASPTPLSDGRSVLLNSAQGSQLLLIDPSRKSGWTTKLVNLDLAGSYPIAEPLSVGNALLIPLENAQLMMIEPESGKAIGIPFQPEIAAGEKPVWMNPVLLSDRQSVVIADQKRNLYKLSTGKQLRSLNSKPLEKALKGRMDVLSDVVVGVSPGASGDILEFYETGEFKKLASLNFEGRFTWGPYSVETNNGSVGLALSDIEGLVAFDGKGQTMWSSPLPQTVLVGKPLVDNSELLFASTTGDLIRIALANGQVLGRARSGEPIAGTPVVTPSGLLIPGDEGSILRLPLPIETNANGTGSGQ
ncbi:MAG: PQQ-binding-like beta-propeller repeat protein [Planctomycetota bacterium]